MSQQTICDNCKHLIEGDVPYIVTDQNAGSDFDYCSAECVSVQSRLSEAFSKEWDRRYDELTDEQKDDDVIVDQIAQRFHEHYERIAPTFDYETRPETAVPWDDVPEDNRWLMAATVQALIDDGSIRVPAPVDEHPPTFHVIEGSHPEPIPGPSPMAVKVVKHWHVNWVAANGEPVWWTENYVDRSWVIRTARSWSESRRAPRHGSID